MSSRRNAEESFNAKVTVTCALQSLFGVWLKTRVGAVLQDVDLVPGPQTALVRDSLCTSTCVFPALVCSSGNSHDLLAVHAHLDGGMAIHRDPRAPNPQLVRFSDHDVVAPSSSSLACFRWSSSSRIDLRFGVRVRPRRSKLLWCTAAPPCRTTRIS